MENEFNVYIMYKFAFYHNPGILLELFIEITG